LIQVPFSDFKSPRRRKPRPALARAFDAAWDRFIELEGHDAATDDNRKRLATRIVGPGQNPARPMRTGWVKPD